MKITDYISFTIDRLPKGYVFTYADFITEVNQREAVIKALNRLVAAGKIAKLSKGRYYKPEITPFGNLMPDQTQVVKDLLEENGKTVGYLTGYSIYNSLGLTTQISNIIQIGKNEVRPAFKRGQYTISFIKQNNIITKENIPLLQILDAIRYIKKIPDTTISKSCERLSVILKNLSDSEISTLVRLALKYPPSARALLGTLLDTIQTDNITEPLYKSLNPITKYKLPGVKNLFPEADKWNIV
ncbi:hypothetical protein SAMN05216364_10695 [Porphyromonadaceae bacterium KHP3R9]|jgi:hypothetical protein|nr:hypothetical protein SAMN05216364_10695 [Porphyromonadaceae bacterium KHP3R9]